MLLNNSFRSWMAKNKLNRLTMWTSYKNIYLNRANAYRPCYLMIDRYTPTLAISTPICYNNWHIFHPGYLIRGWKRFVWYKTYQKWWASVTWNDCYWSAWVSQALVSRVIIHKWRAKSNHCTRISFSLVVDISIEIYSSPFYLRGPSLKNRFFLLSY